MEINVKGRRCDVSNRAREAIEDKLSKLEKYDHKIIRVDVELTKEEKPRLADQAARIEITLHSRGPAIRAEAAASDQISALDKAAAKLQARLRKAADRRRAHRHDKRSVTTVTADDWSGDRPADRNHSDDEMSHFGDVHVLGDGPVVVREKEHPAVPMSIDQALYEMELLGHDFFLFVDEQGMRPSVVYARRGYSYGVIRLSV